MTRDPKFQERYDDSPARFQAARCLLKILKTLLVGSVGENREECNEIGHIVRTRDIKENRQTSRPISIGDYCFVGSNSVLLGGAALLNYWVLGAKLLLNKSYTQTYRLYGGVPARVQFLSPDCGYFNRRQGFVI